MRYSCGHVSTKKNVRGIKDAATSTPPQLRSSRYIRYRDNISYPRYGERYDIGDNQYSSNNLSYCPINRFLESITILSLKAVGFFFCRCAGERETLGTCAGTLLQPLPEGEVGHDTGVLDTHVGNRVGGVVVVVVGGSI